MSIAPVGSYTPRFRPQTQAPAPQPYAAPQAPQPQVQTGGNYYQPSGGGLSLGRMASWAAGGFAAARYVLPMLGRGLPGLVTLGVVGAGAFGGNWVYNKLAGAGGLSGSGGGEVGRYVAWGGGALTAYKLGMGMVRGGRPSGLVLGAMLAGGALAGNWIYNKLTGR
ncbi:MAG: hypothetical protein ACLGIN_10975 [Candidatus Sericytochromatia bacterium]